MYSDLYYQPKYFYSMRSYLYLSFLFALLISTVTVSAQSTSWTKISDESFASAPYDRQIVPSEYQTFDLDLKQLTKSLDQAPQRFSTESKTGTLPIVEMPDADGELQAFRFVKSGVMHPKLAAKYPDIKTYIGVNVDNPTQVIHCGVSPKGFHGMILSPDQNTCYIDIYASGMTDKYIAYSRKNHTRDTDFQCHVEEEVRGKSDQVISNQSARLAGDCEFRVFELALACTGEYAQFHGGTVEEVMAAYAVSMVRVNGVYEKDVNLTMVLIENTDELIFLDASTDPYTNNNGGAMLGQNQSTIDEIIGLDNYDIGHVFSTGGGGIAQLRSPCSGSKAQGVTGQGSPIGDSFWIDYVAHEMGHQYGGNHTQNNGCNRVGQAAVEPGSASTIMGYAGICNPNVQNNSDDHFHAYNLAEFAAFLDANGGTCPDLNPSDNRAPTITVESDAYIVPIGTTLRLTAEAEDTDTEDVLTYCWEQMDSEVGTMPPEPTNDRGPAFRSNSPILSPTRYLPNIQAIIDGETPVWEVIPSVARDMSWRCTVRDNSLLSGGCTAEVDVDITFSDEAGPFLVEVPNTSDVTWRVGGFADIAWDVANTDAAPVSASTVDIYLSEDGGYTYPYTIATAVPNIGTYTGSVPNVLTDQARIMVVGTDNIFFDISNENFSILEPLVATFNLIVDESVQVACLGEDVNYEVTLISFLDYDEEVTFSTEGAPQGVGVEYASATTASVGANTLTVTGTDNLDAGNYTFDIVAEAVDTLMTAEVELIILESIEPTTLNTPSNGAKQVSNTGVTLEWDILGGEEAFIVELSTDPSFSNILTTTNTPENIWDLETLESATVYYWRVKGQNQCQEGDFGPTYAFQTAFGYACTAYTIDEDPIAIPPTATSVIQIADAEVGDFIKINIDVLHEWVGDLIAIVTTPSGDQITLFDQPGIDTQAYGCPNDDMLVSIYDGAELTAQDLTSTCEDSSPTISGEYQPIESLSGYAGIDQNGAWQLDILDDFPGQDDGTLESWSIEICNAVESSDVSLDSEVLLVPQGQSATITQEILLTTGDADLINYYVTTLPSNGSLQLDGGDAMIGSTFTQSDIDSGRVTYLHTGVNVMPDSFTYDILDDQKSWLQGGTQEIQILANDLTATAMVTRPISCPDASDGEVTVTIEAGNAPYAYFLDGDMIGDADDAGPYLITDLSAGTYEFRVLDRFDYEVIVDIEIQDALPMIVDTDVNANTFTVSVTGGTEPYQYSINGGDLQSSATYSSLNNGTYTLLVVDANGCEMSGGEIMINIEGLQMEVIQEGQLLCSGESDAVVRVPATDGYPPYEYRIVGQPWQDSDTFEGLAAGNYIFRVRDAENNVINVPMTITQPDAIVVDAEVSFNTIVISGDGGTGILTYLLDGSALTTQTITDLDNGDYTLTAIDENDCEVSQTVTIAVEDLTLESDLAQGVECFGGKASIMLEANGGIPPYEYRQGVSAYQDSPIFADLAAGTYTFRVRDAQGKTAESDITISQPDIITGDLEIVNNTITVIAVGGTGDLVYQIDDEPTQSSNTFSNLPNGTYAMRITDQLGCSVTIEAVVDVAALLGEISESIPPSCTDDTNGSLTLAATEGIPPYSYSIDGTTYQDTPTFSDLGAGDYLPSVRDDLGQVTLLGAVTFVNPEPVSVTVTAFGQTITLEGVGGTGPYTYSVDAGDYTAETDYMLPANGAYGIGVRDANGCEGGLNYELNFLQSFVIVASLPSCAGEDDGFLVISDIVGGEAPYTYFVNGQEYPSQSAIEGLAAGEYDVTVQDATGYSVGPQTVVLTDPEVLSLDYSIGSETIDLIGGGGTGALQYSLDGGVTFQASPTFTEVINGDYVGVVMDANGCTTNVAIVVSSAEDVTESLDFSLSPNPSTGIITLQLNSDLPRDVKVHVTNTLGQSVYSIALATNKTIHTLDLDNLANGQYQVTITDGQTIGVKKIVIQH